LGNVGDLNVEIDCLLRERGIDLSPFSANALACLPSVGDGGWSIDEDEVKKRRDLRNSCRIFSVDPVGCQDIDDAMHAKGECMFNC
jgi:exoribonuclease R